MQACKPYICLISHKVNIRVGKLTEEWQIKDLKITFDQNKLLLYLKCFSYAVYHIQKMKSSEMRKKLPFSNVALSFFAMLSVLFLKGENIEEYMYLVDVCYALQFARNAGSLTLIANKYIFAS